MPVISMIFPLCLSLAVQILLWFNLLFPYNILFENFNRHYYFALSLSGLFAACLSLVFYRILVFERVNKIVFAIASVLQFACLLSCAFFFVSSLTGWFVL